MKRKTYTTLAAIHLGSEMLRLRIVEYRSLSRIKVIEQCEYPIRLGEEAFKNKSIPFSMVEEICQVLQGFKELYNLFFHSSQPEFLPAIDNPFSLQDVYSFLSCLLYRIL